MSKKMLSVTSIVLSIAVFLLIGRSTTALVDPAFVECGERGYQIVQEKGIDWCQFPDGSRCEMEQFNDGKCGTEFMVSYSCVPIGAPIWSETRPCCEGGQPSRSGTSGMTRCERSQGFWGYLQSGLNDINLPDGSQIWFGSGGLTLGLATGFVLFRRTSKKSASKR